MNKPAEHEIVERAAAMMGEHWECVQILVSRDQSDGTARYFYGTGNWFGRQGMAHDFITSDGARTNAAEIGKALNHEDDR